MDDEDVRQEPGRCDDHSEHHEQQVPPSNPPAPRHCQVLHILDVFISQHCFESALRQKSFRVMRVKGNHRHYDTACIKTTIVESLRAQKPILLEVETRDENVEGGADDS